MCTGFDAPHDSLEFKLLRSGVPKLREYLQTRGLPFVTSGSLVCAFTPTEQQKLPEILHENHSIGTTARVFQSESWHSKAVVV